MARVATEKAVTLPPASALAKRGEPSASQALASLLRDEIAKGRYVDGAKLPNEQDLVEHFALSRPTCREALRILQSEGLLVVSRGNGGGARVRAPETSKLAEYAAVPLRMRRATLRDTMEVRLLLEPAAVARLARRPDPAVLSSLAQIAVAQDYALDDRATFAKHELAFREALLEHCGSEPLRLFGLVLDELIRGQWNKMIAKLPPHADEGRERKYAARLKMRLVEEIRDGKAEKAETTWRGYLEDYVKGLSRHGGNELLL